MDPDIGEFELIERFFRFSKDKGVPFAGDDCAYLEVGAKTLAVTGDTLVEGVHFFADDAPEDVAWKILNVNLSDLAVCGARPLGCLLQASLPGFDGKWLSAFSRSLQKACETHDIPLIGGDTVKAPDKAPKTFGLTAFGETEFRIRRSGAKPGDDIWVTGHLGMASCALELITTGR